MTASIRFSNKTNILLATIIGLFFVPGLFNSAEASNTCGYSYPEVPIVSPSPTPPECEFSANDLTIEEGESTVLSWSTDMNHYTKEVVYIEPNICSVVESGTYRVSPSETTTYTLYAVGSASGSAGTHYRSAKCEVTITVIPKPEPEPPTCDAFTATPSSRVGPGDVTLEWETTNATHVTIDNQVGAVPVDGSETAWVEGDTVFKLTATNNAGSVTCQTSVEVVPPVFTTPPTCDAFQINPSSRTGAGYVTFFWRTTDAERVWISGGVGSVPGDGSEKVYIFTGGTYTLTAINAAGTDECTATVTVQTPPPPPEFPSCDTFKATPESLVGSGDVALSWETTNASFVRISGIGFVSLDGSRTVFVEDDTTWTLTALNSDGENTCEASVQVIPDEPYHPVCDAFTITPSTLEGEGDVTFEWSTTNATAVSIDNGIGAVDLDGTRAVHVTETGTYTLTASDDKGRTHTCKDTVTVTPTVCTAPPPVAQISYTGDSFVGGYSSWDWSSENKESHSAQFRKFGCDDGTDFDWTPWGPAEGLDAGHTGPWFLDSSHAGCTYEIEYSVVNSCGDEDSDIAQLVLASEEEPKLPTCDSFTASPEERTGSGDITLSWETTNATNVTIDQSVGDVALDGSKTLRVTSDTLWTLTATNDQGSSVTCNASVDIRSGGGGSSKPRCDLDISDKKVDVGDYVTLSWDNKRTSDILLEDDHGETYIDTKRDKDDEKEYDEDEDSIKIKVVEDTEFTLTAIKGSRDDECSVEVEVEDGEVAGISYTGNRYTDGIVLSATPYTGFEAGKVLTFIFYLAIGLWAAVIAYAAVLKRRNNIQTN